MSRLVIGIQPVREAIRVHGNAIERVLLMHAAGKDSRPLDGIARWSEAHDVPVQRVDRQQLDRITHGGSHQGAIAYAPELQVLAMRELLASNPTLITVLDRITDPQNFGAIIRSSVAFQADGILWPEHDSAPLSPATFRASAGAIEHARLCRVTSLPAALHALRDEGMLVVGLAGESDARLEDLSLDRPTALVVGAEGSGLRKGVRDACERLVRLPTAPPLDTLNASVSAAIALYEVRRQRMALDHAAGTPA